MAVINSNLELVTGCDFYQEFTVANPDFSPIDITDYMFHGAVEKHPGAIDANSADSERVTNKLTAEIVDASRGTYCIKFPAASSLKLEEGKYVYQVLMVDPAGTTSPVISGLMFVNKGFGIVLDVETGIDDIDGGSPGDIAGPDTVIVDGGTPSTVGSGPSINGGNPMGN